jgi:predicted RNA-binding Zn-ribbon protein involved in translation (DUF1610 family)
MAKGKVEDKNVEYSKESVTIEELYQDCPKCNGNLLVKFQTDKELQYKCDSCGYEEVRNRK